MQQPWFSLEFVMDRTAQDLTESDIDWLLQRNGVIGAIRDGSVAGRSPIRIRMNRHPTLDPAQSPLKKTRRPKKK
jgi:hypothetical protein